MNILKIRAWRLTAFTTLCAGLVLGAVLGFAHTTLSAPASLPGFPEDFGSGSDLADIPDWEEKGSEANVDSTIAKEPASDDDTASTDEGRFARIGRFNPSQGQGGDGWICRGIDATGLENLTLSYYWRGDTDAESEDQSNTDYGHIEYLMNGSCETANQQWSNLVSHVLDEDTDDPPGDTQWSSLQTINLPPELNGEEFFIRFRAQVTSGIEHFRVDGIDITGEEPTGSVTICKVILDNEGNVVNGSNVPGTDFSVTWGGDADFGPSVFSTALSFNADVLTDVDGDDAECITYDDGVPYGSYDYAEEVITGNEALWETPKYYEIGGDGTTTTLPAFFLYNEEGNNGSANGNVVVSEDDPERWVVVLNQHKKLPTKIVATKIMCDAEEYLPNWGAGAPDIDGNTATNWLEEGENDEHCWLQEGWNFEWEGEDEGINYNEHNNEGPLGEPWTQFGPTDENGMAMATIDDLGENSYLWVREVWQSGHIPFTGQNTDQDESAEIYCATDVLNYDNYERIDDVKEGGTYYCVAFNAPLPEPEQCTVSVVSDTDTTIIETGLFAELTYTHPAWTADIPGATWIWDAFHVANPTEDQTLTFEKTFFWNGGAVDSALLDVASDNSHTAWVNGVQVGQATELDNFRSTTQDQYNTTAEIVPGYNTLRVQVDNDGGDANPEKNPAGGLFKLDVTGECAPPPTKVVATKIVCDDEVYLPNWGDHGPDITADTATDFLSGELESRHCRLEPDWDFEWAPVGTLNPGDNTGLAGGDWTQFGPTDENGMAMTLLPVHDSPDYFWVREAWQDGYVPFTGLNVDQDVSAEMWCQSDVLNYDNYDRVDDPLSDETEYCVAFNAPETENMCELTVVSDETSTVNDTEDNAVATYSGHPAWTAFIPGATWIWPTFYVQNPTSDETNSFTRTFEWHGPVGSAILDTAGDNSYKVWINGELVIDDTNEFNFKTEEQLSTDVTSYIEAGVNTIKVEVKNWALENGTELTNPAGALWKLSITGEDCGPKTSTVTICKIDREQNPLGGWTLMLLGGQVDELSVPSETPVGADSTPLVGGASYVARASGVWLNDRNPDNHVDAEYSTEDSWTTHMDGFTGYQTDILELQIAQTFDPASNWGAYNSAHTYAQGFVPGADGPVNFRIFDGTGTTPNVGWYGDNHGSLDVDLYEGFAGITDEQTGCVTFEGVPLGEYNIDEILLDGWENLDGLGGVSVDDSEETFYVVNTEEAQCSIEGYKYDTEGLPLANWEIVLANDYEEDDNPLQTTLTDENGFYCFGDLHSGDYEIGEVFGEGWTIDRVEVNGETETHYFADSFFDVYTYISFDGEEPATADFYNSNDKEDVLIGLCSDGLDNEPGEGEPDGWIDLNDSDCADLKPTVTVIKVVEPGDLDIGPADFIMQIFTTDPEDPEFTFNGSILGVTQAIMPGDFLVGEVENANFVSSFDGDCVGVLGLGESAICTITNTHSPNGGEGGGNNPEPEVDVQIEQLNLVGNGPIVPNGNNNGDGNGLVLGETTGDDICDTPYLRDYLRRGWPNDPVQVQLLQAFLNTEMDSALPITGYFGALTENVVKEFQSKYATDILVPWGIDEPTGFVYQTTRRKINLIQCSALDIPIPLLVPSTTP